METREFRIDKTKVLTNEYKLDQTNPGNTIQYVRNSTGTLMVDSNNANIKSQRLVINLVNTRYKLLSFNNVLKTQFEEFLDPEIVIPETQQQEIVNQTSNLLDLQNQLNNKDEIINNLQQTVSDLSTTLSTAIPAAAPTETAETDTKKARIFSDGTLIRDKDRSNYFYIIEDGKKRFFYFNDELLLITARALGKIKVVNGETVPDTINVSQSVIDDIPSGAPFYNFDLVKNVQTPPPPPLDLGGNKLVVDWIYPNGIGKTPDNPIIINVTDAIPSNEKLVLDLQLQYASAQGIVNTIEVWDWPENVIWFDKKPNLPIKDGNSTNNDDYKSFTNAGSSAETRRIKVILKDTTKLIKPTGPGNGFAFADRYEPITVSMQKPEFNLVLTPKILNDVNDVLHAYDKKLYVKILYTTTMPDVMHKTQADAITTITNTGLSSTNIAINALGPRTDDPTLFNKVSSTAPLKNTLINGNTQITMTLYRPGTININSIVLASNQKFNQMIQLLKSLGFNNITVNNIRTTTLDKHENVYKITFDGTSIPISYTTTTNSVKYDSVIELDVEYYANLYSTFASSNTGIVSSISVKNYLNSRI